MEAYPVLQPTSLGRYNLKNRVVMAPLTRCRATKNHIPTNLIKTHYEQRASAGLIITEATYISTQSVGYMHTPGIYNQEQIDAWREVTKAVHQKGGVIFLQIWHTGRVSHSSMQPQGQLGVSASAIAVQGTINTFDGVQKTEIPRALNNSEIKDIVKDFYQATLNAIEAGFDGVEIHGANGYLIDQFINDHSNIREDNYGGSIENRCRFAIEVVNSVCKAIGSDRTGIRLSPSGNVKGMYNSQPVETFSYLIKQLNNFDLAYLHIMEPYRPLEPKEKYKKYLQVGEVTPYFRKIYKGILMTNVGFTFDSANDIITAGNADLVAFGKPFISNPDLVERFRSGAELSPWDKNTFYEGGEKGYNDYPTIH